MVQFNLYDDLEIIALFNQARIIIIMQNLTQIKSRQFHKYGTIEPFTRGVSYNIIEDQKTINKQATLMRSTNQNHYHLANVVKQILEIKPKTAQKIGSKQSSRKHITQNIGQFKPSLQYFCNNAKQKDRNFNECSDNEEQKPFKTSLSKQKRHFNFLQIDNRLNSKKVTTSKSSRTLKRQFQRNSIEAINLNDHTTEIKRNQKNDQISGEDHQCRIRITKRKTQTQIPKTKISIKNLDKQIDTLPRQSESRTKRKVKYDLNLPRPSFHPKEFQQDIDITDIKGWKQRKTKKSNTDFKVPQFIKISLQSYQQEPTYLIEELEKRKIRQQTNEKVEHIDNPIQQQKAPPIQEKVSVESINEEQKLVTNKIRLVQKQRKKTTVHIQEQNSKIDDTNPPVLVDNKVEKKRTKSKKKVFLDQMINICGWEEEDPERHYFKL